MSRRSDVESRVEECPNCAWHSQEYCDRHLGMIEELPKEDRKWFLDEESDLDLDRTIARLEEGKVLQASGDIRDQYAENQKIVYVEWYVAKIDDIYVAVNDANDAKTLGCEREFAILINDMDYEVTSVMEVGNTPYDTEDFEEILEEETCDCEEPIAFRPEASLWTCSVCNKPLKDQDRQEEEE